MCDIRVLISILYTTTKLQISLKIVCKIYCMVSDNDCDVAVCDIKGRGDFSPPSDFVCTSYIQNLCLHISIPKYHFMRCIRFHQKNLVQLRSPYCLVSYLLSALYLLKLEKNISYMTCVLIARQRIKTTRQRIKTTRQRIKTTRQRIKITRQRLKATRQRLKTTRQREILTFLSIIELN